MSVYQEDTEVLSKGRKKTLKDTEEIQVTASLRDQIPEKLAKKLEDKKIGQQVVEMWQSAQADRSEWIERQREYMKDLDEFIEPLYPAATDWSSTLHMPTTLTIVKTFHARMNSALMGVDPPFNVRARKASNSDRAPLIESLMNYTIKDWANCYEGIESEIDGWIWDWVAKGLGYLKTRWHKEFTRYTDIEQTQVMGIETAEDPETGELIEIPVPKIVESEVERVIEKFNGPMVERVPVEDLITIGDANPQKAEAVIQACWYTASELWTLVDQKIFRRDAVEKVIRSGETMKSLDEGGMIKQSEHEISASGPLDVEYDKKKYKVYEAYLRIDVDGSGIDSDVIAFVDHQSRQILRATYLHRVMQTGLRPFHHIEFHKRNGSKHPIGLVELMYSIAKEIDAMHNIRIDVGILTSLPWGFYKPTSSTMKEEKLPVEPGSMIPLDNPSQDVFFPNLGSRTGFGFQEEAALLNQVERLTSISDISLGIVAGQGATRTATGTRALIGEANANLDIYLKRMNRGWKSTLKYLFHMLQDRLPPGFQFRILGDDGNQYWGQIESPQELAGMFDFELEGNSANSNKQILLEQANLLYQLTGNPLDLQLGIISPRERYEAIKRLLKVNGIKDVSKFVREPNQVPILYSPKEIADRILSGVDVTLDPTQDLQGFLQLVQSIVEEEELNGQFDQFEIAALVAKAQEAQALLQALQQQQAQVAAIQQQQINAQATQTPGNMQAVGVQQAPPNPGTER